MDEALEQIIETVKSEAESKSEQIINAGKAEAESVIQAAKKEAASIREAAKQDAERTRTELMSQLRLAARDFILELKGELEQLMALAPLRSRVAEAMADPEFLCKLVLAMVTEYSKAEGADRGNRVTVTVPASMQDEMAAQLPALFQETLKGDHPLIELSDRLEGFTFSVGDTGEVTITPEAIVEGVKPFVLDRFHELLEGGAKDAAG